MSDKRAATCDCSCTPCRMAKGGPGSVAQHCHIVANGCYVS